MRGDSSADRVDCEPLPLGERVRVKGVSWRALVSVALAVAAAVFAVFPILADVCAQIGKFSSSP